MKALTPPILIIILTIAIFVGCCSQKTLGPNNPVEEIAEAIIEEELDLPPDTFELPELNYLSSSRK